MSAAPKNSRKKSGTKTPGRPRATSRGKRSTESVRPWDAELHAIGDDIRRRRHAAGMTQDTLAEHAELTPNYIGTIELGKRDPSLSTLTDIARGLKISVGDIVGPPPPLSEDARAFAGAFHEAPTALRHAILMVLRTVVA